MNKGNGYFIDVLGVVQSVMILAKIFGHSELSWIKTMIPTISYILAYSICFFLYCCKRYEKIKKDIRDGKCGRDCHGRDEDINKFIDDGK